MVGTYAGSAIFELNKKIGLCDNNGSSHVRRSDAL